jgi:predicted O-methyltransferase YrrM
MKSFIRQIIPPFLWELAKLFFRPQPLPEKPDTQPIFTNTWFATFEDNWEVLLSKLNPTKILEIGSFEGASICFLIRRLAKNSDIEIHCIDTWEGGLEHKPGASAEVEMNEVEIRFHHNTQLAIKSVPKKASLFTHKAYSDAALVKLLANGKKNYFDLIYIDGSHQAPDVLFDAVASFKLLRLDGIMVFDDYLWAEELPAHPDLIDPLRCPKPAIDSFINLNIRKLKVLHAPLGQLYIQKVSD